MNLKAATDQLHSLFHAGDANTRLEARLPFSSLTNGRSSRAMVADFQGEMGIAMNLNLGSLASRMALNIGQAFLHDSE